MDVDSGDRRTSPRDSEGPESREREVQVSNPLCLHYFSDHIFLFIEYTTDIRPCAIHPSRAPHSYPSRTYSRAPVFEMHIPLERAGRVPLPNDVLDKLEYINGRLDRGLDELLDIRREVNELNDRLYRIVLAMQSIDDALHLI